MLALSVDERIDGLVAAGSRRDLATQQVAHLDELMTDCILALYRSAVTVGDEWEDAVTAMPRRPALVLWGADDPYVAPEYAARLARRIDGELLVFDECSHWWPWERARESAAALERLWKDAP